MYVRMSFIPMKLADNNRWECYNFWTAIFIIIVVELDKYSLLQNIEKIRKEMLCCVIILYSQIQMILTCVIVILPNMPRISFKQPSGWIRQQGHHLPTPELQKGTQI